MIKMISRHYQNPVNTENKTAVCDTWACDHEELIKKWMSSKVCFSTLYVLAGSRMCKLNEPAKVHASWFGFLSLCCPLMESKGHSHSRETTLSSTVITLCNTSCAYTGSGGLAEAPGLAGRTPQRKI